MPITTIIRARGFFRYFSKFNNTYINENTDILEYQTSDIKVSCLLLGMMPIDFHTSLSLNTKGYSGTEKILKFYRKFVFPKCTNLDKSITQGLHNKSNKQTMTKQKTNRRRTRFYRTKSIFQLQNFI